MFHYFSRSLKSIKHSVQLRGSHELFQIYALYQLCVFHFTIDVLNLKLCFATDVLIERSGSLFEPGSIFFHSDLNLLMEFLYFTG